MFKSLNGVAGNWQPFRINVIVENAAEKGRKNNMVRDIAIYLSRGFAGDSGVNFGKYFGKLSGAGITVRYKHLAR